MIRKKYPVWHFDATGSILKHINGQKKPYLYSLVSHDQEKKIILPIAEFFTTSHNSTSISKYLTSIKKILFDGIVGNKLILFSIIDMNSYSWILIFKPSHTGPKAFIIAPFIVVDFSWALINAIIRTFNNCSVAHYIKWSYDVIHNYHDNTDMNHYMSTRVILCQVHILKKMAQKASDIIKLKKAVKFESYNKIKEIFLYGFTILQNSMTVNEFDDTLKYLYFTLNSEFNSDMVSISIDKLRKKIYQRNSGMFDKEENFVNFDDTKKDIYINDDDYNSIKVQSPFSEYYKNMISSLSNSVVKSSCHENEFYMPEFFELISEKLYLMPLWSGILIKQGQKIIVENDLVELDSKILNITRLDNNFVENHFGHYKYNLFQRRRDLVISEIAGPIYKRLKAKYIEHYTDQDLNVRHKEKRDDIDNKLECWKDRNRNSSKRTKSHYYKGLIQPSLTQSAEKIVDHPIENDNCKIFLF